MGADWFIFHNIFAEDRRVGRGLYIDIGASQPFHLSNTAFFDECLGWRGVCIEPNPRSRPVLLSYRSCSVLTACAWANVTRLRFKEDAELAERTEDESLVRSEPFEVSEEDISRSYFEAECAPLHNLLEQAVPLALGKDPGGEGRKGHPAIELLSVDAEGAEIEIFRGFPFEAWDIHVIVVEVSRRSAMAIDSLLLPRGFVKAAVLGKDAVYVKAALAGLLASGVRLPDRIAWNEPGTEEETTPYQRFQSLFGAEGDLDADVGDQRLENETELQRHWTKFEQRRNESRAALRESMGPTEHVGQALQLPEVQETLRDPKVKSALLLLEQDAEAFARAVKGDESLLRKVRQLHEAGFFPE